MTATLAVVFGSSSSRVSARPAAAPTPITRKNSPSTQAAATRSGSSPPVRLALPVEKMESASKARSSAFQSSKSGAERLLSLMPSEGLTPSK